MKNDSFNGINPAFLLNVRASVSVDPRHTAADNVAAERARRRVTICETQLTGKLDAARRQRAELGALLDRTAPDR